MTSWAAVGKGRPTNNSGTPIPPGPLCHQAGVGGEHDHTAPGYGMPVDRNNDRPREGEERTHEPGEEGGNAGRSPRLLA